MPDCRLSRTSAVDPKVATAHYNACAEVQNLTSESLDLIIVARMALLSDRGSMIEKEKDAVLTVLGIAEERAQAAYTQAKAVAQTTVEALNA